MLTKEGIYGLLRFRTSGRAEHQILFDQVPRSRKGGLGDTDYSGTFVAYCKKRASGLLNERFPDTDIYCAQNSCQWPDCNYSDECYVYTPESENDCYLGNRTVEETFYYKYG